MTMMTNRRHFLQQTGFGLGTAALSSLLFRDGVAARPAPGFVPKAKRVI